MGPRRSLQETCCQAAGKRLNCTNGFSIKHPLTCSVNTMVVPHFCIFFFDVSRSHVLDCLRFIDFRAELQPYPVTHNSQCCVATTSFHKQLPPFLRCLEIHSTLYMLSNIRWDE